MTVKTAVHEIFKSLPKEFYILELIRLVRRKLDRPLLTDGTITRQLRLLRGDVGNDVNYRVIDRHRAIYEKIYPQGQLELKL